MIANVKSGWYIFMRDHRMATSCGYFLLSCLPCSILHSLSDASSVASLHAMFAAHIFCLKLTRFEIRSERCQDSND
jgi:hypothetical protein